MATRRAVGTVTMLVGGDVGPIVEPTDQFVELVLPVLRGADLRMAQCERTYSQQGWPPHYAVGPSGQHSRLHPRMASIFKTAGIDVVSMASNHAMDWGPEPLVDSIKLFRSMGMEVVGAGSNGEESRRPAVVERNGVMVAILAYCSVLRDGQAAAPNKPGVAPMRARTYYEPVDFQPGTPPMIITVPYEEDLAALQEDIRMAKAQADVVILSMHWGVPWIPKLIPAYQPQVAHAAIDAGADLILGHHAHLLKAVEVYKGKVCFYSIGNFLTTGSLQPGIPFRWNLYWYEVDPDTSLYGFSVDAKKSMIAKAVLSKNGVERVSFLPTFINRQAQPEVLKREDDRFQDILRYMEWVSDQFPHTFKVKGNEIVVETSA